MYRHIYALSLNYLGTSGRFTARGYSSALEAERAFLNAADDFSISAVELKAMVLPGASDLAAPKQARLAEQSQNWGSNWITAAYRISNAPQSLFAAAEPERGPNLFVVTTPDKPTAHYTKRSAALDHKWENSTVYGGHTVYAYWAMMEDLVKERAKGNDWTGFTVIAEPGTPAKTDPEPAPAVEPDPEPELPHRAALDLIQEEIMLTAQYCDDAEEAVAKMQSLRESHAALTRDAVNQLITGLADRLKLSAD